MIREPKVDPDYFMCREGEENGYFATDTQGTTYVNEVWPGDANYPDLDAAKYATGGENTISFWSTSVWTVYGMI